MSRYGMPPQQIGPPIIVVTPKSAGLAVLLSFLWLGAGHLYVGRTVAGVLLVIFDFFLFLLALTVVGFIIAFPVWLVSVVVVMLTAAAAAGSENHRIAAQQRRIHR